VPLEQSNIVMLLGSSGVVKSVKIPLKMFVKMLTHSRLRWCTYGVGTFAKGLRNWLMILVCGGSWLAILL
jgi:hypothetical protein